MEHNVSQTDDHWDEPGVTLWYLKLIELVMLEDVFSVGFPKTILGLILNFALGRTSNCSSSEGS